MFAATLTKLVLLSIFFRSSLAAIGPTATVTISNAAVSPDGFSRFAIVTNGQVSGPLIKANKGDTFSLNVVNTLNDASMLRSTSIHWHGFFQKGTTWADGPAFVSQCPIVPGASFNYEFSTATQAGTFWYHSHLSTQYCDGLRGPMVVYDPNDPHASLYDVDDESTVITLSDWYHVPARGRTGTPTPDSTLFNGLGRWSGATGTPTALSVITVTKGLRYRLRLVNAACSPNYVFSVDGHTSLTIIEADGENTDALVVDSLTIFAGQRYSVILNADQNIGNYFIRAKPSAGTNTFTGGINSAILRYVGAAGADPTTTAVTGTNLLAESNLHAFAGTGPAAPGTAVVGGADKVINLPITNVGGQFRLNGTGFVPPTVPVLLQILSGAVTAAEILPQGSIITLPLNSVIELSIPGGGNHPFHLHGHSFSVIRSAGSTAYNFVNPVRRDVFSVGAGGDLATIRFRTDNSGPWLLHCHIDWHFEAGLAVVLAEDAPGTALANPVPQEWSDLCPAYNALPSGSL